MSQDKLLLPFYTRKQLSEKMNMTKRKTGRAMAALGVPEHMMGNKYVYFISDISLYAPKFFASVIEACSLSEGDF